MKKGTFLSLVAISALVYSCKKDDDKSNAELILGKWNEVSAIDNDHYNNIDHKDTSTFAPGVSTIEFKNNGIFIEKGSNYADTAAYKVEGSNVIVTYPQSTTSDTVVIKSLSGSDMQLYFKEVYGNNEYYESTSNWKK
jgi:hypothetical protein